MQDSITKSISARRCDYCGGPLDSRIYFCPSCAKPHRSVEDMLPASPPPYEDNETRLRTQAGPAWTVLFAYLGVILMGSMFAFAIWGNEDETAAMLFVGVLLAVTTLFFLIRSWDGVRPLLVRPGFGHSAAWIGVALLVPMLLLNFGFHRLLIEAFHLEKTGYDHYFFNQWGQVIFICVVPAIIEEIGFRGIIQDQFERVVSPSVAIGVASLVFSMAHFSILSAPYLALVGVLLGWMKWKSGSLYPSMLAHFLHNFIVITYF